MMALTLSQNEHWAQVLATKWPYIFYLATLLLVSRSAIARYSRHAHERKKGYGAIPSYPQKDPFLAIDLAMSAALKNHGYLKWLAQLHVTAKPRPSP